MIDKKLTLKDFSNSYADDGQTARVSGILAIAFSALVLGNDKPGLSAATLTVGTAIFILGTQTFQKLIQQKMRVNKLANTVNP